MTTSESDQKSSFTVATPVLCLKEISEKILTLFLTHLLIHHYMSNGKRRRMEAITKRRKALVVISSEDDPDGF